MLSGIDRVVRAAVYGDLGAPRWVALAYPGGDSERGRGVPRGRENPNPWLRRPGVGDVEDIPGAPDENRGRGTRLDGTLGVWRTTCSLEGIGIGMMICGVDISRKNFSMYPRRNE